ncbi:hypothetical protein Dester_0770 [Desulfurobacterium thermolithotrophum DSM 11699]|uniref:Nucleoside recognition domain protein n=1 Tax=Desulfurobacterium thermolithotrophum (strain DSM 11699 / BSA) TaxID=868864 RepID=F0S3I9_DESTD|nr:hypothetical protein [Desulfurobacterium thermolithotrophum]ADY73411.1 hypothetical protein Dester_0770 [Desulfurobacterium thermolithotrophum DSM 11699]
MDFTKLYLIIVSAIAFGYVLASILVETKLVNWIGLKTLKLSKFGIHPLLTNVPVIYLVSPRAAHITASNLLKEGKIEPIDLYLAILASNFPMRLMFLYRYYFPVLVPLIGVIAVYYGLLRLAFDVVVLIIVSIIGKIRYRNLKFDYPEYSSICLEFSLKTLKEGFIKGLKEAFSFILKFTPLFFLIVFLIKAGFMEKFTKMLKPYLGTFGFNSLEITYITTAAVSPPVAYGLIKIMIEKNHPVTHILGTMAVGNAMFSLIRSWWAYLLPYYLGLYPISVINVLLLLQAGLPIVYNFTVGIILVKFF